MTVEFQTSKHLIDYPKALKIMEDRVSKINDNTANELVWFLEHPAIYTAGTSADSIDLINSMGLPVYEAGRGGQYTYHGPGQRIIYLMLDLKNRGSDLRKYVENLENWIIASLKELGIDSERKPGRIGIWTIDKKAQEAKIAAIGIRVRKWVTYHGISINVTPDLDHYQGIIPCGIKEYGVTSFEELGYNITYSELDNVLRSKFYDFF